MADRWHPWPGMPARCTCSRMVVVTLEETLACPGEWRYVPGAGWVHGVLGARPEPRPPRPQAPCGYCGTWTCARCGWQRQGAPLARPEWQECWPCGGTEGTMRPTIHHSERAWILCGNKGALMDLIP